MEQLALPSEWSDGSSAYYPREQGVFVHQPNDLFYHQKLADLWMVYKKKAVNGRKYIFTALPDGYRIYTKQRGGSLQKKDRYLFGHEHGKFDSPNKFFEHFKYIMEERRIPCSCINCSGKIDQPIIISDSSIGPNEGDDIYSRLETYFKVCEDNADSEVDIDWERSSPIGAIPGEEDFREILTKYRKQPSFLPRIGELVLFHCNKEGSGRFEQFSQQFKLYDESRSCFQSYPLWRAGVISHEPRMDISLVFLSPDARIEVIDNYPYGIELFTGPEANETSSNHTLYIALSHIRPLTTFHEMLSGIPQNNWHTSIHHALTLMCTTSILDPVRFLGRWPRANIECSGLWIGPELLVLGDTVRLLPPQGNEGSPIDTVLVIDEIEWVFADLSLNRSSRIYLRGKSYTIDKDKALGSAPLKVGDECIGALPTSFSGHTWYPMFEANENGKDAGIQNLSTTGDNIEVPASLVIGRLYESKAMEFLLDGLDFDVSDLGIQQGRKWAKAKMCSAAISDSTWILTKDRTEALRMSLGYSAASEQRGEWEHIFARNNESPDVPESLPSDSRNKRKTQLGVASKPYFWNQNGKGTSHINGNRTTERTGNVARDENVPHVNGSRASARKTASTNINTTAGRSENESEDNTLMPIILARKVIPPHREGFIRGSITSDDEHDDGKQQERSDMSEPKESESDREKKACCGEQVWKRPRIEEDGLGK